MIYGVDDWKAGRVPPKGWDAADCISDGWTADEITAFMRAAVRPWPCEPDPDPEFAPPPPPPPAPVRRSYAETVKAAQDATGEDMDVVEAILADAAEMSHTKQDALLRVLKNSTGIGLTALRRQMKESAGDDEKASDHLEIARRAIQNIGHNNLICAGPFVWMWSDGGVWCQQEDRGVKQKVQTTIEGMGLPVNSTLVNGVSEVLKTEIFKSEHRFNRGEMETVNVINGHLVPDGDGWRLDPHCRENYRTTQVPIVYDPTATAPLWSRFLTQIFEGDEDSEAKQAALMEMMGYTLMSHALHELFILMIGTGGNGKSVVIHVLEHLCGAGNVAGVQPSNFDRAFQRAHLDQKLANIVTEIKQGEVIADAELKGIVSGEKTTVEHKFKDPFDMHPFATCWFGTNHMPHTRDFSDALFRRALILTFNQKFEGARKDPNLKPKLEQELPGILNMALAAYRRACLHGFTKPASSEEAKHEWRLEADQVAMFVDEKCTRDPAGVENATLLFQEYQAWAGANGISKTMSLKGLRDRLTRLGFGGERRRDGRYVTGIRIGTAPIEGDERDGW